MVSIMWSIRTVCTHLHVTSSSVEVEVDVLDVSIFGKEIGDIFFRGFFVNVGRDHDPSLYASYCDCVFMGFGFGACGGFLVGRCCAIVVFVGGNLRVDFHSIRHTNSTKTIEVQSVLEQRNIRESKGNIGVENIHNFPGLEPTPIRRCQPCRVSDFSLVVES